MKLRWGWAAVALTGALTTAVLISSCATTYYEGPAAENFDGTRFFNPGAPRPDNTWEFWKWQFSRQPGPWPAWAENPASDTPPPRIDGEALRVSFVNHATVLLQTQGLNILTDPIWAERASPVSFIGPKRVRAPGIAFEALPKIDVVLVSHNHYDHMNLETLARIWRRDAPRILAPLGNDTIIRSADAAIKVETLNWGDRIALSPTVSAVLEPMQHWSARTRWDTNLALWGSFVIEAPGGAIYFVGDTGYGGGRVFHEAAAKYGGFRFTLMPIGAYQPRWFMEYAHQSPEEAVQAHLDARSCFTLATQHSTFPMADDGHDEPLRDLAAARDKLGVAAANFRALMNGEHWLVPAVTRDAENKIVCPTG